MRTSKQYNESIKRLLATENEQAQKLHSIVSKAIDEEKILSMNLLHPPKETLTIGQKLSDKIARFGGSWMFISSFLSVLAVWIVYNVVAPRSDIFDPYPFILMNLVLSCIAAIQAPIIMMSQNRTEEKDRLRAENDYMINLKAELEIRSLHSKIDLLIEEQLKTLYEYQQVQLEHLKKIDTEISKMKNEKNKGG